MLNFHFLDCIILLNIDCSVVDLTVVPRYEAHGVILINYEIKWPWFLPKLRSNELLLVYFLCIYISSATM